MFTGIIEELGTVADLKLLPDSAKLTLNAHKVLEGTQIGDSIAVNGVCLTVVALTTDRFSVDVMAETLQKTSLAEVQRGSPVNLERALQLQTRLGGHLVSGHVDGVGIIKRIAPVGIAQVYHIAAPQHLLNNILPKGSIAIDGISLTVVEVTADHFTVSLIPHTFGQTTLGKKGVGHRVNLETDMIGKYVAHFLSRRKDSHPGLSLDFLAQYGFV